LLYVTDSEADRHDAARIWFEDQMNSGEQVALPWFTLVSFLRLATQRGARKVPMTMDQALTWVHEWLEWETVWIPEPTARHHLVLSDVLRAVPRSAMVSDAHVAAIAIEHGLTMCSADVGFKVFPGLKFHNPLQ
jgi:toxin-antitoxin system PIN domain toxin